MAEDYVDEEEEDWLPRSQESDEDEDGLAGMTTCYECGEELSLDEAVYGPDGNPYCPGCEKVRPQGERNRT